MVSAKDGQAVWGGWGGKGGERWGETYAQSRTGKYAKLRSCSPTRWTLVTVRMMLVTQALRKCGGKERLSLVSIMQKNLQE